jgi:predicted Fe-Mo cluster-binding NifX family protein
MKKTEFKKIVEDGVARGKSFIVVKIATEGSTEPEIIINPIANVKAKMTYYDKAYNDDLELIAAKNNGTSVRITDVLMTTNLNDLNWFAY